MFDVSISYLMKKKYKELFLSNFLYKILLNEVANAQDFAKLTVGTGQHQIRYNDNQLSNKHN